jgi:hypothetical protein
MLKDRRDSMHELAINTDGRIVPQTNALDGPLKQIADDLTSYYLLGYYSTNSKLDGRFRSIKVAVKRPGVDVRARRGYRAPTREEVTAARSAAAAPVPEPVATVNAALNELTRIRPDAAFQINAVGRGDGGAVSRVWVAGEFRPARAGEPATSATADIQITGAASASRQVVVPAGQRTFLAAIPLDKPVSAGAIEIRARLTGTSTVPYTDTVRIDAGLTGATRALLFRRGPLTGNQLVPAAAPQFSRTERVRIEVPAPGDLKGTAGRVLDRKAQPLAVPVTIGERTDSETGERWITADVTLAPLTLGDYAVEIGFVSATGETRLVTAIRVGR